MRCKWVNSNGISPHRFRLAHSIFHSFFTSRTWLLCLLCLLAMLGVPHGADQTSQNRFRYELACCVPADVISIFSEHNSIIGEASPDRYESWSAVVIDGLTGGPKVGATIRFTLENSSQGGTYSFEGGGQLVEKITNSCGLACVAVKGQSPTNAGSCTIRATYIKPNGMAGVSITGIVSLKTESCVSDAHADPALS